MFPIDLDKPLAVFDVEATGVYPRTDRIIDLSIATIMPGGGQQVANFRFNPGIPIPPEASAIHGIMDTDVVNAPSFAQKADDVLRVLGDSDLAGFNLTRFDIPILAEEFLRAGKPFDIETRRVIDVQRIFHRREPRDLTAALSFYCGQSHTGAHGAEADVLATMHVLEAQLRRYEDLPRTVKELHEYCDTRHPDWVDRSGRLKWHNSEVVLNFGKKRGTPLRELIQKDPHFVRWLLNSDFPRDMQDIVRLAANEGKWPKPPSVRTGDSA